jgi:hypothetical protein
MDDDPPKSHVRYFLSTGVFGVGGTRFVRSFVRQCENSKMHAATVKPFVPPFLPAPVLFFKEESLDWFWGVTKRKNHVLPFCFLTTAHIVFCSVSLWTNQFEGGKWTAKNGQKEKNSGCFGRLLQYVTRNDSTTAFCALSLSHCIFFFGIAIGLFLRLSGPQFF